MRLATKFIVTLGLTLIFSNKALAYSNGYWEYINNKWNYKVNNEVVKNSWIQDKGLWYYLGEDGDILRNTYVDGFYLNRNGVYQEINSKHRDVNIIKKALLEAIKNGSSSYFTLGNYTEAYENVIEDIKKLIVDISIIEDIPIKSFKLRYDDNGYSRAFMIEYVQLFDTNYTINSYYEHRDNIKNISNNLNNIEDIINYIVNKVDYDFGRDLSNNYGYRCLYDSNKTMCLGYTSSFSSLLTSKGIKNRIVVGYLLGGDGDGYHAWNEVYINDKWESFDLSSYDITKLDRYLRMQDETLKYYKLEKRIEKWD